MFGCDQIYMASFSHCKFRELSLFRLILQVVHVSQSYLHIWSWIFSQNNKFVIITVYVHIQTSSFLVLWGFIGTF